MLFNTFEGKVIELESPIIDMLLQVGIKKGQIVLDFGCGYGMYTIPVAEIVGMQGRVYALDKDQEALDALMKRGRAADLRNIERMETSGELEIRLMDESVDVVLLFDVFHSFFFPRAMDRTRLLGEIRRVMKSSAFLSISVWPNLIEPEYDDEIIHAGFYLEKEVPETLVNENQDIGMRIILNFRKEQYVLSMINQSGRRQYG
jgi:ubiquinone/menaquinone biosynthesis C-methylase UbiE